MTRSAVIRDSTTALPHSLRLRLCSFGELQQCSEVPIGTLKHWITAGAIVPTGKTLHNGTGNPRQFPASEMVVVNVLAAMAAATVSIGHLFLVSRIVRHALHQAQPRRFPWPPRAAGEDANMAMHRELAQRYRDLGIALLRAVDGEGENMAVFMVDTADKIHFQAVSDAKGDAPLFDLTTFLPEGTKTPKVARLMVDLNACLRGILD